MKNQMYDPLIESLKAFWDSQQERISFLSGITITDDILRLASDFGESELMMFEKLMETQKQLATMSSLNVSIPAVSNGVPNPVIDNLDMSDPRTVRRFEIHNYERSDVARGESNIPTSGIILLLGRKDGHTDACAEFLANKGLTVKTIETDLTEDEAEAVIAKYAKEAPVVGMVMVANAYDENNMESCIFNHTMTAVYLIKHYTIYIRGLKPSWKSMVLFATFLDGKLGFTGENKHYAYGTFNGVAKTLSIEFGYQADIKLIDFEPDVTPKKMIEIISDELCIHDGLPEIGRTSDGKRWSAKGIFTDAFVKENRCPYNSDDVIIVTGGSRGVTAQCIMALLEKAPCKVAILGRAEILNEYMDDEETAKISDLREMKSFLAQRAKATGVKEPLSAIEKKAKTILAQRDMLFTFSTLEKTGSKVKYYPCDVNNKESLSRTVSQIQNDLGVVCGIIHGAGLLADCKIWNKEMSRFRAVLETKYAGLNNLLSILDKDRLKMIVSFSSVAGYFGNDGQMDYAAGNEFLDKFAHHFRKRYPNCKSLTINWGAWDGGMMDYIYRKTLTDKGYVLIPMEVGAGYFANEILNGLPYGQVLISNDDKPVDATRPANEQ